METEMRITIEPNKDWRGKRFKDAPWKVVHDGATLFSCKAESKTAARAEAEQTLVEAYSGDYAPVVLCHRGTMLVASRDPQGWGYRMIGLGDLETHQRVGHCSSGFTSREDCLRAAVFHLGENTRKPSENTTVLFDLLKPGPVTDGARRIFASNAARNDEFQARYDEAINRGMSTVDAHDCAGRNPARRELWQTAV
jgi:hypothetical protein